MNCRTAVGICRTAVGLFVVLIAGQIAAAQNVTLGEEFDACGVLQQQGSCVVLAGSGGTVAILAGDFGGFGFGDTVRVVGTLDPNCTTICDVDGCVRGATVYDPAAFPCGTALPNFPGDIITNACAAVSTTLLVGTVVGCVATRRRRVAGVE